MIEWFNNLGDSEKIAITIPVGLALIGGLFALVKSLLSKKKGSPVQQNTIQQKGKEHTANIAGRDIHTGINEDALNAALKALNTALSMVDTDQSKDLVSELKKTSDEKLSTPIELEQDKRNNEQKPQLEKEFELYGKLWKALVDVKSSIIITPTLDRKQKSQSFYDLYNDRYKTAADAFSKANQLLEYHRPFFHDDVCTITDEFLGQCRGYIRNVARMLKSENFDEDLHDKADELFEIIPKAIDEIEKAIKRRIGLLPKSEIDEGYRELLKDEERKVLMKAVPAGRDINTTIPEPEKARGIWGWIKNFKLIITTVCAFLSIILIGVQIWNSHRENASITSPKQIVLSNPSGNSVFADDYKSSSKVDFTGRYISDGLLIYNELTHESEKDFIQARKNYADLLNMYLSEMKVRQLEYSADLLSKKAASILKELKYIRDALKKDIPPNEKKPNDWARKNINASTAGLGDLLDSFGPSLETPFDIDGFEKLGNECREQLLKTLEEVTVKLSLYIKDLTTTKSKDNDLLIERAADVCVANRKAILLLFTFRFIHFEDHEVNAETSGEGFDVRLIRQFNGDINRTTYWNGVLQKRLEKEDALLLKKYSANEYRRLRILKAISDKDMLEAQTLLLKTFKESLLLKPVQTKP